MKQCTALATSRTCSERRVFTLGFPVLSHSLLCSRPLLLFEFALGTRGPEKESRILGCTGHGIEREREREWEATAASGLLNPLLQSLLQSLRET